MAYASNLNPAGAPEYVTLCRERGYRAFKLKVAFELAGDRDNVRRIQAARSCNWRVPGERNKDWARSRRARRQAVRQTSADRVGKAGSRHCDQARGRGRLAHPHGLCQSGVRFDLLARP